MGMPHVHMQDVERKTDAQEGHWWPRSWHTYLKTFLIYLKILQLTWWSWSDSEPRPIPASEWQEGTQSTPCPPSCCPPRSGKTGEEKRRQEEGGGSPSRGVEGREVQKGRGERKRRCVMEGKEGEERKRWMNVILRGQKAVWHGLITLYADLWPKAMYIQLRVQCAYVPALCCCCVLTGRVMGYMETVCFCRCVCVCVCVCVRWWTECHCCMCA